MGFDDGINQSSMSNHTNLKRILLSIITCLLILLWIYTSISKIMDMAEFKRQLYGQAFNKAIANILLWLIPSFEIITALLLVFVKTRYAGLLISCFLMALFTGYIGLVVMGYYARVPCSCGGVLKNLGWQAHLWFNLFFLSISCIGIYLNKKTLLNNY